MGIYGFVRTNVFQPIVGRTSLHCEGILIRDRQRGQFSRSSVLQTQGKKYDTFMKSIKNIQKKDRE